MTQGLFDAAELDIGCPSCGEKTAHTLGVLKTSPELECPACGLTFQVNADQLADDLRRIQAALDRFGKR